MTPRPAARKRLRANIWLLALLAAGCAAPPPAPAPAPPPRAPESYVVLLPSDDGTTGAIIVTNARETVVLDRPLQALRLDGPQAPEFEGFNATAGQVEGDFGPARAALPRAPEIFRLYFATNSAALAPASQRLVEDILDEVRRRPGADVSIIGHTDTVGEAASNERLGRERAEWVARLLRSRGLTAVAITVASHGESDLLVRTPDGTDEVRNRRVEVTVR